MSKHAAFYVAIFATTALFIGYAYAGYRGNAAELATRLRQVPILRNARDRYFGRLVLLSVLSAAVIYVLAKKHHG
jgi:amino acid transporter